MQASAHCGLHMKIIRFVALSLAATGLVLASLGATVGAQDCYGSACVTPTATAGATETATATAVPTADVTATAVPTVAATAVPSATSVVVVITATATPTPVADAFGAPITGRTDGLTDAIFSPSFIDGEQGQGGATTAVTTPSTVSSGPELANTGAETNWFAYGGLALLAAGFLVFWTPVAASEVRKND